MSLELPARRSGYGYCRHAGAWGTAVFPDGTALDVRDEWREAVFEGLRLAGAAAHARRGGAEADRAQTASVEDTIEVVDRIK